MHLSKEEWFSAYPAATEQEKELLCRAYDTLMGNVYPREGYPWSPYRLITPGKPRFPGVWNWDTAFHSVGVSRWDTELAKEGIRGFLQFQGKDGILPDVVFEDGRVVDLYSKPPVFAWATGIVYQRDPDRTFLQEVYPKLVLNERFWREKRCYDGLFFYDSADGDEKHIRFESGWDNAVRWDHFIGDFWPIDLNCFMVMAYDALAFLAKELNLPAEEWLAKKERLSARINQRLWNGQYYADTNRYTEKCSPVLTPASFMPLYVGIATMEQAEKMAKIAADPQKFNSNMPTVSYDDPGYCTDYWRGPVWLNVAYFAAKGLKNYGFSVADAIRSNILELCYQEKNGIYENYDSIRKQGANVGKKGICCNCFGWSSVFIIEFILGWSKF